MVRLKRVTGWIACTLVLWGILASVAEARLIRALIARRAQRRQAAVALQRVSPSMSPGGYSSGSAGGRTVGTRQQPSERLSDVAPGLPAEAARTAIPAPSASSVPQWPFDAELAAPEVPIAPFGEGDRLRQAVPPIEQQRLQERTRAMEEGVRRMGEEAQRTLDNFRREAERTDAWMMEEQRALEAQRRRQREELQRWQEGTRRLLNEPQRSGIGSQSFPGRPLPEPFAPTLPQAQPFRSPSIAPSVPVPRIQSPPSSSTSIPRIQSPPTTPSFSRPSFSSPSFSSPRITSPSLGTGSF